MQVIEHKKPILKMPTMLCDTKINDCLDDDPILKNMNKRFICGSISKAGGGKTTQVISFLQTKKKMKRIFYQIFLFMPASSRASIKNSIFNKLPEEQLFEGVNIENLNYVYEILKENSENKKFTLLIFDDVQSYLKNTDVEKQLLHIIANSRHLRCCMFILAQNYNKIPQNIRASFTDLFLFNIGKKEYEKIFDENVELDKDEWKDVIKYFNKQKETNEHSFIYIHEKSKFFVNYDELKF